MEIKYELHKIENSQGTGNSRVYIQLRNNKSMTPDELMQEIQDSCTLKAADVKAVMTEISEIAIRELADGNKFYLPGIGYLSLAVGNTPPDKKANGKLTGKDVYLKNIRFRPEKKFIGEIKRGVSFTKSDYSTLSARYTEEGLWAKVADYLAIHRYLTRQAMRTEFGLSQYMTRRWLARFVESGRLKKDGTRQQDLYFL